jgi:hypothetical protein
MFKKNKTIPAKNPWAFRKLPETTSSIRNSAGPRSVYMIVWGIIFLLSGLGMTGWGGYSAYVNYHLSITENAGLKQISSDTPQQLAAIFISPIFMKIAVAKMERTENQAADDMGIGFGVFLLGIFFFSLGNVILAKS